MINMVITLQLKELKFDYINILNLLLTNFIKFALNHNSIRRNRFTNVTTINIKIK